MKILKRILLFIAILVAIPLVAALFVKKQYSVERSIAISKPNNVVFNYVRYLKNQDSFSKWANIDPLMKKEYRGTDGTVGFVSAWDSEQGGVGKGEQEIKRIVDGQRIDLELRFERPFPSIAPAYMITEPITDTQTKVRWGFTGKMPYPLNAMLLVMDIEQIMGDDIMQGLVTLKGNLERGQ